MFEATYWVQAMQGQVRWYFKKPPTTEHLHDQTTDYFDQAGDSRQMEAIEKEIRDAIDSKKFTLVEVPVIDN